MTLVPNETEQALNRQYDIYAAAREEYRKKIAEQVQEIERMRAALEELSFDFQMCLTIGAQKDAEIERLRAALEGLLQCPHIADRDIEPAWIEPETEDAIAIARAVLEGKHE